MKIIGHSSPDVHDRYSHFWLDRLQKAAGDTERFVLDESRAGVHSLCTSEPVTRHLVSGHATSCINPTLTQLARPISARDLPPVCCWIWDGPGMPRSDGHFSRPRASEFQEALPIRAGPDQYG
jgi:hypothetical protein